MFFPVKNIPRFQGPIADKLIAASRQDLEAFPGPPDLVLPLTLAPQVVAVGRHSTGRRRRQQRAFQAHGLRWLHRATARTAPVPAVLEEERRPGVQCHLLFNFCRMKGIMNSSASPEDFSCRR